MHRTVAVALLRLAGLFLAVTPDRGQTAEAVPATVIEAAKVLDLAQLPRLPKAEDPPSQASLASLSYRAAGGIAPAYEFQQKSLTKLGWKELPGGYSSEQYASGTFSKQGYTLSVTVIPDGDKVGVMIMNHGNVDLAKIPVPAGAKSTFAGPVSLMYTTAAAQDATRAASRKLLEQAHWEPYGDAGDTQYYRQNAVRLSVTIAAAPALDNKTVITVASELMSAELPAPKEARELQYSDSTTTVTFETAQSIDDLAAYYRKVLESQGWKATTDNLIKIDFRHVLIFRNAAKELRELTVQTAEDGTRASLKHQSATQVAEEEARGKAAIAKRKAAMNAPKDKVAVALPAEATDVKAAAKRVEFHLKSGRAKGFVVALQKQFLKEGWKEESAVVENEAGTITFTRGELNLSVIYVDPSFIPAEVTISLIGGELEVAKLK